MAVKSKLTQGGDGTAIPEGFVGYVYEATSTGSTALSTTLNTATDVLTLTIGKKGVYDVEFFGRSVVSFTGGTVSVEYQITNNTPTALRSFWVSVPYTAAYTGVTGKLRINVTSDATIIRLRALSGDTSGTPTISANSAFASASSPIWIRATLMG